MKTTQQKFEEILSILQLNYQVKPCILPNEKQGFSVYPLENQDSYILLENEDSAITVYTGEEVNHVLYISDETSVGIRVLDIENILIQHAGLHCGPIALSTYLYCSLFGMLWGLKFNKDISLKDGDTIEQEDPLPKDKLYIVLYGYDQKDELYVYEYLCCADGCIKTNKYWVEDNKQQTDTYSFYPIQYLTDTEKTVQGLLDFFRNTKYIKVCKFHKKGMIVQPEYAIKVHGEG